MHRTDDEIEMVLADTRGLFDVTWVGRKSFELDNADNKNRREVMAVIEQLRHERDEARRDLAYEKNEHKQCHVRADAMRDELERIRRFLIKTLYIMGTHSQEIPL